MKKLSLIVLSIFCITALSSCDEGELGPVMNAEPGSPSITSPEPGTSYTLDENAKDETAISFEWTNPDYGFAGAPDVVIEMDQTGNDFSNAMEFARTQGTSYSVTVGELNSTMLGAGFSPLQEVSLDFRVSAIIADTSTEEVSEPVTVKITPYSTCRHCPEIYVPGGYQSASGYTNDWSPADAPALATVDLTDNYEGYVYMANANSEFKFTAGRSWSLNWGDDGADGSLEENAANIVASEAGYYKINVDLNSLTYQTVKTTWGLIGSATANGWDSDQDMTYDAANKVWTITADLSAGDMKFRANDEWTINYGDTGGDGSLEQDGDNISIGSAGNYTIELDLSGDPYTYTITQN